MVTQARKAACPGEKRMPGLLALGLCIHGCMAWSSSACTWFYTPVAAE